MTNATKPMKAAPVSHTMRRRSVSAPFPTGREPSGGADTAIDASDDLAHDDASGAAGSQAPPIASGATRGGDESRARSSGERAARSPASEGPGRPVEL